MRREALKSRPGSSSQVRAAQLPGLFVWNRRCRRQRRPRPPAAAAQTERNIFFIPRVRRFRDAPTTWQVQHTQRDVQHTQSGSTKIRVETVRRVIIRRKEQELQQSLPGAAFMSAAVHEAEGCRVLQCTKFFSHDRNRQQPPTSRQLSLPLKRRGYTSASCLACRHGGGVSPGESKQQTNICPEIIPKKNPCSCGQ